MKKILIFLFISIGLIGCKGKPDRIDSQSNAIVVVIKDGNYNVHPQWRYVSDKPVDYFHTMNMAYWIDEKKIQVLATEKSKKYKTMTYEVDGSEWTYTVENNKNYIGRVCFAEVVFFTYNDGSVAQQTYMSNVVEAPNRSFQ